MRNLITNIFRGYAQHPECGQKIEKPYGQTPGTCPRCGATIKAPCREQLFKSANEHDRKLSSIEFSKNKNWPTRNRP